MSEIDEGDLEAMPSSMLCARWLMCSYLYYDRLAPTPWSDAQYDYASKRMLDTWDEWTHRHKHLLTREHLEAGTGYDIQFPTQVQSAAWAWLDATHDAHIINNRRRSDMEDSDNAGKTLRLTLDEVNKRAEQFAALNQRIKDIECEFAARMKPSKDRLNAMRKYMESVDGLQHPWKMACKGSPGYVRSKVRETFSVKDRPALEAWLAANYPDTQIEWFANKLVEAQVRDVYEQTGELPDGVSRSYHESIVHTAT